MDVHMSTFLLCYVTCTDRRFAMGLSPAQEVLPIVCKIYIFSELISERVQARACNPFKEG
jgi:hypothetical protein